MKDIKIYVSKETRKVDIERSVIGNDAENLQGNLVFSFCDDFVDGIARIEYTINNESFYQMLEKQDEEYIIPIKSVLTKKGQIDMQLVITERGEYQLTSDTKYKANKFYFVKEGNVYTQLIVGTDYEIDDDIIGEVYEMVNIPIFKSNIFYLVVNKSINAEGGEAPEEYKSWIEIANQKLIEIDEKIEEVDNLNIESKRVEDGVEITITKKDGTEDTKKVNDGEKGETGDTGPQGEKGDPALINGYNTIEIVSGTNIEISQEENTLTINNTYDDTSILQNISTLNSAIEEHDRDIQNLQNDIERIDEDIRDLEFEVNDIEDLIPNQATTSNQLADKSFVNSSIATNTAYFRGTFNSVAELMAYSGEKTLNDYAYVVIYDEVITTQVKQYDRYKYNGTTWVYEYTLNNSSFTAQQWASINSGITQALTEQITTNQTNISNLQIGKQDNLTAGTGISIQNNVISAENTGKVVEIGSNQYSYDGYILPAISVDILRSIYTDDRAGTPQLLHWTLYGSENNFKVVSSDSIAGEYSIDILVHNKYHCAYTWTNQTTGIVNPIVITSETLTTDDIEKTLYYDTKSTANEGDIITTKSALDWRTNNVEVDGNYKQETTTGKNLINIEENCTFTQLKTITTPIPAGTYYVNRLSVSGGGANGIYARFEINSVNVDLSSGTFPKEITLTQEETTIHLYSNGVNYIASEGISATINQLMVSSNSSDTYEPYTGGIASPNPDYPQEIEVVDGYNLFNCLDYSTITLSPNGSATNFVRTSNAIEFKSNSVSNASGFYIALDNATRFVDNYDSSASYTYSADVTTNVPCSVKFMTDGNVIPLPVGTTRVTYTGVMTISWRLYVVSTEANIKLEKISVNKVEDLYLPYNNIGLKFTGKNLLNAKDLLITSRTVNGLTYTNNGDGTFNITGTATANTSLNLIDLYGNGIIPESGVNYYLYSSKEYGSSTFNISCAYTFDGVMKYYTPLNVFNFTYNNCTRGYLTVYIPNGTTINVQNVKLMFVKSDSIDTNFEPYQETITPIDLQGNTINKVGNIKDELIIDKQGNVNLVKKSLLYTLTGTEEMNMRTDGMFGVVTPQVSYLTADAQEVSPILCNILQAKSRDIVYRGTIGIAYGSENNYYKNICIRVSEDITTIEDFKTWLGTHELKVCYLLATQTTINLGKLPTPIKTKEGINNIELLTNIDTTFNIKYVMNIKDYIDSLQ